MGFAPFAVLLELDLASDKLAILAGPIVDAVAFGAGEFEKLILGHIARHYIKKRPVCNTVSELAHL